MKFDPTIKTLDDFMVREVALPCGTPALLVNPRWQGATWTPSNLHYRSSVWTLDGELVSAGFPKFFNLGEKPDLAPDLSDLSNTTVYEKIDGSCLIVSAFNGQLIVRTRGTVDAYGMANGHELNILRQKYPQVFDPNNPLLNGYSLLFEWVSPENQIVLKYPEPDLYFLTMVQHDGYRVVPPTTLTEVANKLGVQQPKLYSFGSIEECANQIKQMDTIEGVCVYKMIGDTVKIVKVKTLRYLRLHAFRSSCTPKSMVDLFIAHGAPSDKDAWLAQIESDFDYECRVFSEETVNLLWPRVEAAYAACAEFQRLCASFNTKKEFALHILTHHKNHASMGFHMWDNPNKTIPARIWENVLL